MGNDLTHFNESGQAHMVDVGHKASTHRQAIASGAITMNAPALEKVLAGDSKKGDVLGIARVAGIMAAKQTGNIIPLCHPIGLTHVGVDFTVDAQTQTVICQATTETVGQTGVEMEAMLAASAALLTVYDMLKAVDRGMVISTVALQEKKGGKSGHWQRRGDQSQA